MQVNAILIIATYYNYIIKYYRTNQCRSKLFKWLPRIRNFGINNKCSQYPKQNFFISYLQNIDESRTFGFFTCFRITKFYVDQSSIHPWCFLLRQHSVLVEIVR